MKTTNLSWNCGWMLVLALAVGSRLFAGTTWSNTYDNVTSAYVAGTAHSIASAELGVYAEDSNGQQLSLDQMTWSINKVTYDVSVTFTNTFTGALYISGPWPTADTSQGFALAVGTNPRRLFVCGGCETNPARKTWNGSEYVAGEYSMLQFPAGFTGTVNVRVYIRGNRVVYGLDTFMLPANVTVANASIEIGVTFMPSDVVPLGSAINVNSVFGTPADLRIQPSLKVRPDPIIIIIDGK
ncbi:MAG: hypothetical protein U0Q18_21560 [Bryobacteraceae bacterium]